jgi:hypothetical protein
MTSALDFSTSQAFRYVGSPRLPCVCISAAGQSHQDRNWRPVQTLTPCSTKTPVNRPRCTSSNSTAVQPEWDICILLCQVSHRTRLYLALVKSCVLSYVCAPPILVDVLFFFCNATARGKEPDFRKCCSLPNVLRRPRVAESFRRAFCCFPLVLHAFSRWHVSLSSQ